MDDYWIKSLGFAARGKQLPDKWGEMHSGLFHREFMSAVKHGMKTGDGIVYYASGTKLIFAVGEIVSYPFHSDDPDTLHAPWRVKVKLTHWRDSIADGVPLAALNVADRDLRLSIKRRSAIRLKAPEYAEADRLLGG